MQVTFRADDDLLLIGTIGGSRQYSRRVLFGLMRL
jgi:hypothetical protein